ncbi:unnamed protein product [Phytophthora lilii]|uniref:Unnamed protein product n=1 Tax=Phytophthora lilii TaxID=2077276 RepID=A0A9W6X133_9STRA|nr:unnamed protein product [Phytophthora lilii]
MHQPAGVSSSHRRTANTNQALTFKLDRREISQAITTPTPPTPTREVDEIGNGLIIGSPDTTHQKLVLSDQEIYNDVIATMPKLNAAVRNNAKGGRWKHYTGKGGVHLAEMKPYHTSENAGNDPDILHSVAAKTELRCHLNEALSVLLHQNSNVYDSTMKSLCGKQFKRGDVLFDQQVAFDAGSQTKFQVSTEKEDDLARRHDLISSHICNNASQCGLAATATVSPQSNPAAPVFNVYPSCSPLKREIDHIGIGFDLQFTPSSGGSHRQHTQIFAHAYASDKLPSAFSNKEPETDNASGRPGTASRDCNEPGGAFDDEDLLSALGPIIVETPSDAWIPDDSSILSSSSDENGDATVKPEDENLTEQLCSEDPETRSRALEILSTLVGAPKASPASSTSSKATNEARTTKSSTKQIQYQFDASKVSNEDVPLAPMPEAQKDARRVEFVQSSGALQSDYDRSALDLIAQVAAKRLGCPIGVVSMIDDKHFHAVGNYNLPAEAQLLPRNEVPCMHSVYAKKPLVIKNPQRDMRFSKMPCVDDLGVKFYAGFPLHAPTGEVVGNLCALDGVSHNNISTKDYATMQTLAKLASDLLAPASR